MKERNAIVFAAVCQIPPGRVATYGQIARICGLGRMARQVCYALNALPADSDVPWHRVINAKGEISLRSVTGSESVQRLRLEQEGVSFNDGGRVSLAEFGWDA